MDTILALRSVVSIYVAVPDASKSSVIGLASNYTAGAAAAFSLKLTDAYGNPITEGVSAILTPTTFRLKLAPSGLPPAADVPYNLSAAGPNGVTISFTPTVAGNLSISLVIGGQQLLGTTGKKSTSCISCRAGVTQNEINQ